jgi:hypothetical protein
MDYGFRRNLWGRKPAGVFTATLGTIASLARVGWIYWTDVAIEPVALTALAINLLLLVIWLTTITPSWVKVTADAYAKQLLEACDMLEAPAPEATRPTRRTK